MTFYLNIRYAERYNKALDRLQEALDACNTLQGELSDITIGRDETLDHVCIAYNALISAMARAWEKVNCAERAAHKAAEKFYGRPIFATTLNSDMETRTLCVETAGFDVKDR